MNTVIDDSKTAALTDLDSERVTLAYKWQPGAPTHYLYLNIATGVLERRDCDGCGDPYWVLHWDNGHVTTVPIELLHSIWHPTLGTVLYEFEAHE